MASHVVLPVFSAAEESSTGSTGSPPLVTNGTAVGGVPGDGGGPERVVAVVEVVQNDRALNFAEVGRVLGACLQVRPAVLSSRQPRHHASHMLMFMFQQSAARRAGHVSLCPAPPLDIQSLCARSTAWLSFANTNDVQLPLRLQHAFCYMHQVRALTMFRSLLGRSCVLTPCSHLPSSGGGHVYM